MNNQLIQVNETNWTFKNDSDQWLSDLESGKILYFPNLPFNLSDKESNLLNPEIRNPKSRNISLNENGILKGALGDTESLLLVKNLVQRFRDNANTLINSIAPQYKPYLKLAPTSLRPMRVESRQQSIKADDKRVHVDAFPSRPNYGERILRVFININPHGEPRVWRIGEPFENVVKRFLTKTKKYSPLLARLLQVFKITKSYRSEYDHLMLQLHDLMKYDESYQANAGDIVFPFPPGSVWVCFSDQATHGVLSGQYMMEQTYYLPVQYQAYPSKSPLKILEEVTGKRLT